MFRIPRNRLNYGASTTSRPAKATTGRLSQAMDLCIEQIDHAERADAKITSLRNEEGRSEEFRAKCDDAIAECQRLARLAGDTVTALSGIAELAIALARATQEIVQEGEN